VLIANMLTSPLLFLGPSAIEHQSGAALAAFFLQTCRVNRELTQHQLATSGQLDRVYVLHLEAGRLPRGLHDIKKLAEALSVPPEVLTADAITIYRDGRIEVARG
jgi:transcriptional regulator with XRE-family HTH domain